ncbi:MAG: LysR family transcriptional regulator [Candidatus Saccharibacteria bacterium]|nr:LysR family transcriptional regulator [Moraxellaceae bacterium]
MNTASLQAFVTVMQTGSVSRAAEKLFLTQPAISKRLRILEDEFGVILFTPIGRGIQPTQAAQDLLPRAKRWLLDYEEIKHALSHAQDQVAGLLRIGTSHHIGLHHLPTALKSFVQAHPEVELDVHFVDSEQAHQAVLAGELELAFLTLPPTFDPRLTYREIWNDPLVFVVAPFHPLARKMNLTLADLTHYPAILPAANTYTSQITLDAFHQEGLSLKTSMSTNPLDSIRMLVSIGLGWSVLPKTLVDADLVVLSIEHVILHRTLGMVWHPQRTLSKAARTLKDGYF